MGTVVIEESLLQDSESLHAKLASALAFPPYYGHNLSALSDCLGDIDRPTRVVIRRERAGNRLPWLDGFCRVFARCARENPLLELLLQTPMATASYKEEYMEELKLDLSQDATRRGIRSALFSILGEHEANRIHLELAPLAESGMHFHGLPEVLEALAGQPVSERVRRDAEEVYRILAEAEAEVHGCTVEQTHFHEVGDAEAVANVLGICLAMEALDPRRIVATPVQVGEGTVECAHGVLDIPAPATAAILARGIPVCPEGREGEWCTPTSAAIILHFVDSFES